MVIETTETKDEDMNVYPVCGKPGNSCECSEEAASGDSCGCRGNCGCH